MTDTVESVLAEMREVTIPAQCGDYIERGAFLAIADRLAAAHARDQRHYAEIERTWEWHKQTTIRAMTRAEVAEALLREALPYVKSHAEASHLTDGFKPQPANKHDELAARVSAIATTEQAAGGLVREVG